MMRATIKSKSWKWAAKVLKDHNPHNRDSTLTTVAKYTADMEAGNWICTHQAIAFDEDDNLIDGAHRLRAQVASRTTQKYVVVTGCDKRCQFYCDSGRPRTAVDTLKLDGLEKVSGSMVAAARVMACAPRTDDTRSTWTKTTLRKFVGLNYAALAFAIACMPARKRYITRGPVYAAIARAYYHTEDRERLKAFGEILSSGLAVSPKADVAAIRLRNWLMEGGDRVSSTEDTSGQKMAQLCYQRAQVAIRAFLGGETIKKLMGCEEDLFPLPEGRMVKTENRFASISDIKAALAAAS